MIIYEGTRLSKMYTKIEERNISVRTISDRSPNGKRVIGYSRRSGQATLIGTKFTTKQAK